MLTETDPRERYGLYRLCDCPVCEGTGKFPYRHPDASGRCLECRGEGRVRQEVVSCETPEAVGVALVTCAIEGEWEGCAFGLLDRFPECEACDGTGTLDGGVCATCKGSGIKPTGTWLLLPWLPSARNVTDAARTLARSKKGAANG